MMIDSHDLGARGMKSEELDTQRFNGWSLAGNIACENMMRRTQKSRTWINRCSLLGFSSKNGYISFDEKRY
jgi:hypothetical protein